MARYCAGRYRSVAHRLRSCGGEVREGGHGGVLQAGQACMRRRRAPRQRAPQRPLLAGHCRLLPCRCPPPGKRRWGMVLEGRGGVRRLKPYRQARPQSTAARCGSCAPTWRLSGSASGSEVMSSSTPRLLRAEGRGVCAWCQEAFVHGVEGVRLNSQQRLMPDHHTCHLGKHTKRCAQQAALVAGQSSVTAHPRQGPSPAWPRPSGS